MSVNVEELKLTKPKEKWLFKSVLPNYIIYSKKEKYAYCTACQQNVPLDFKDTKPKKKVTCPTCKASAFLKAKGQTKYSFRDLGAGVFFEKVRDCMVIRHFDVEKIYLPYGKVHQFNIKECLREYFNKDGFVKGYDNTYYYGWRKLNIRKYSNYKGAAGEPCYHINFNWDYMKLYTGNLKEVIKGTFWEKSCLDEIFKAYNDEIYFNVPRMFLLNYRISPVQEYLWKVGFKKLCMYSVFKSSLNLNVKEKSLPKILQLDKESWKKLLAIGNPTVDDLNKYQTMSNYKFSEEEYKTFSKWFEYDYYHAPNNSNYDFLRGYYTKSLHQLDKYLSETKVKVYDYADHLQLCSRLGDDLNNTFVLFPKDFKQAHQDAINRWNTKRNEEARNNAKKRNNEYEKYIKKYIKKYGFEENNLKIVIPNGCDEICAEGQNLHHCVGTYIDRVCRGTSIILFVRDVTDLTKSFYTMELQGNKMIQCRGFANKEVTDEVRTFITDFAKQKKIVMQHIA
jgi:hypothetical protein